MTQQYLLGEMSVRLEALQAAGPAAALEVAQLREEAETRPPWLLASVLVRALTLAESMCWDSLTRGDTAAFARLAEISAELRLFGLSARLLSG